MIASAIAFGTQALALTDSKFPVWYPFYGTWMIGITVEIVLLALGNVAHRPASASDYIVMIIQASRIGIFAMLPMLYFGLRNDGKQYDNIDAERQSLLRKRLAPKASGSGDTTPNGNGNGSSNGHTNGNGNGYGTTANASAQESDSDSESDSGTNENEDRWVKREREAKKLMRKRLKQDGNWFTYAKGFAVRTAPDFGLQLIS